MNEAQVMFPVVTLEGQLLLPAGSRLSEPVLAEVAAAGRLIPREQVPLLDYGSVREDLQRCLSTSPYDGFFGDSSMFRELMGHMNVIRLPLPLLHALDHFRAHDFHTYRHSLTVFALSMLVAGDVVPGYHERPEDGAAGPTHDFGKLCIPLAVLRKSSPLTQQERRLLDHHPLAGQVLLTYYFGDHCHPAVTVARDHHERRDGSGYPCGITDLQPIVELVAACDVYDALLSSRPYRPLSYDNRTALEELTVMAEQGKLGWEVVAALVSRNRKGHPVVAEVEFSRDRRGNPPAGNCHGTLAEEGQSAAAAPLSTALQ
jgi:HD-GYP domain-containing protein (c-di-GMP phosphodiesterase class II)